MKDITVSNKLYQDLKKAKLTFQLCDKRSYTTPQVIKRVLEIARSEGFW